MANLPPMIQLEYLEQLGWPPTLARLRDILLRTKERLKNDSDREFQRSWGGETLPIEQEVPEIIAELDRLYAEQWEDLYDRILKHPDMTLTEWEIERITFEATASERHWLKSHLLPHHPLILAFTNQHTIPLQNNERYNVLL